MVQNNKKSRDNSFSSSVTVKGLFTAVIKKVGIDVNTVSFINHCSQIFQSNSAAIGQVIHLDLSHYSKSSVVQNSLQSETDNVSDMMTPFLEVFPTFLFLLSGQLASNKTFSQHAALLRILGVRYLSGTSPQDTSAAEFLLSSISLEDSPQTLHDKAFTEDKKSTYLPYLIRSDLYNFIQTFGFTPTKSKKIAIENHYLSEGIFAVFMKYYFDLLSASPTDAVAEHIHEIFSNFFFAFHFKKKLTPAPEGIEEVIALTKEHPHIKQHHFDLLKVYMPLLIDKKDYGSLNSNQERVLKEKLRSLVELSPVSFNYFFMTIHDSKGKEHVNDLISTLLTTNKDVLYTVQRELPVQHLIRFYNTFLDSLGGSSIQKLMHNLAFENKSRFLELRNELLHKQKRGDLLKLVETVSPTVREKIPPASLPDSLPDPSSSPVMFAEIEEFEEDDAKGHGSPTFQEIEEDENQVVYRKAIQTSVAFDTIDNNGAPTSISMLCEVFLSLPIALEDKLNYLKNHISTKYISQEDNKLIYAEQKSNGLRPRNPIHIVGKDGSILRKNLFDLLKLKKEWPESFTERAILINIGGLEHYISIFDFFTFPLHALAKSQLPERYKHLSQHLAYIRLLNSEGIFSTDNLDRIKQFIKYFHKFVSMVIS